MTSERPGQPDLLELTGPSAPADPGADTAPYAPQPPPPEPPAPTASPPTPGWSPPVPARQEVAPGLVFSDTLARVVAWWIDGILLVLVGGVISAALGWDAATTAIEPSGEIDYSELFVATEATLLGVALSALYFIGSWTGGRRATLGQRILKIQVGNAFDGRPLRLDQAIRRWLGLGDFSALLSFIPAIAALSAGLYLLWVIVLLITTATSPTKQGLHDRLANSACVRPTHAGNSFVIGCFIVLLVLAAVAVLSIVALIFLGSQISSITPPVGGSG